MAKESVRAKLCEAWRVPLTNVVEVCYGVKIILHVDAGLV